MNEKDFDILLSKYINDDISEEELRRFLEVMEEWDSEVLSHKFELAIQAKLEHKVHPPKQNILRSSKIYWIAASLTLFISTVLYFYQTTHSKSSENYNASQDYSDILIDDSSILIKNSSGQQVQINDSVSNYELDNIKINKSSNGSLSYTFTSDNDNIKNEELSIVVPKGKSTYLAMTDGTKVWLNSNSSLTFKPMFEKSSRPVTLVGEGYFEVKSDKSKPFLVNTKTMGVKVLGTSFNVSTYEGLSSHVSLLEGKVEVASGDTKEILRPNQQFLINKAGGYKVSNVDMQDVLAWKNGYFVFERLKLNEVLVYLSNWYNIDNIKVTKWSEDTFTGAFKKDRSLKNILDQLESISSYQFKITNQVLEITMKNQ